ncbi:MAG: tetratricopeptide repeat protein [Lentisphaerae bacterium]|nr:tetratricopeptide repeat protein [Lentisphaerota bacterium]
MNTEPTHVQTDSGLEDIEKLQHFWNDHGTKITIVVAIIAVAIGGSNLYKRRQQGRIADASAQLAAARNAEDLEALVESYGSTPSAPLALLQLAKTAYDGGDYARAQEHYEAFGSHYARHELADVARLGLIHCREARGELQAAEEGFSAFLADNPKHFLAGQASLGQARCLEQLGRFEDARVAYENMVASEDESLWSGRAAESLEGLADREELYNNPPPVAAPMMPVLDIPGAITAPVVGSVEPIIIPATGE